MCDGHIDQVVGYVDSKDLLNRVLGNQSLVLSSGVQIRSALIVPDTLTLSKRWKASRPPAKTSR